jgi:HK97 family phage prohead protease
MLERRITEEKIANLRIKKTDDGPGTIDGHAAVFNRTSRPMKTPNGRVFVERILPGAFTDAIAAGADTKATIHHDGEKTLARSSKGTLSLREDRDGLAVEIQLPNTTLGKDTAEDVRCGNFDKMSFAFRSAEDEWERRTDGTYLRTLKKVAGLADVTLTNDQAAYPDTSLSLRMADDAIDKIEQRGGGALAPNSADVDMKELGATLQRIRESLVGRIDTAAASERRATMTVDDNSLVYCCRSAITWLRYAFDACNSIMDCAAAVNGDLSDRDRRAMDDAYGEIVDLIPKLRSAKIALDALGAEDEDDDEPAAADEGSDAVGDTAIRALKARMEGGTLTKIETRETLYELAALEQRKLKRVTGGKFVVMSADGKKELSKPMSRADALKRLKQIENFKAEDKAA